MFELIIIAALTQQPRQAWSGSSNYQSQPQQRQAWSSQPARQQPEYKYQHLQPQTPYSSRVNGDGYGRRYDSGSWGWGYGRQRSYDACGT